MNPEDNAEVRRQVLIIRRAFRLAINQWAQEQFAAFGRWTMRGMLLMAFLVFVHVMISLKSDDLRLILQEWQHAQ